MGPIGAIITLRFRGKDLITSKEVAAVGRRWVVAVGILIFSLVAPLGLWALNVGDKAPDFTLPDQNGNKVSLSQFLGKKNVVLAFYVLAFTGG